ncbi:MAG: isoprenyl transferase [Bacteroidales bacterium]|nr:isoprenyl transferase [Bacteroidales bacterium]
MQSNKDEMNSIPQHVAIIMDGNGRWAQLRGEDRSYGHKMGAETVHIIAEEASKIGVRFLTLYTFSIENWNRPTEEINALMNLLTASLDEEAFIKNNILFQVIGDFNKLPQEVQKRLNDCIQKTKKNTGMCLTLALSYSSRWEITEAAKQIAQKVKENKLNINDITEDCIINHLTTCNMPDPDLLIRTGGEFRLSNYLLWQCAYTELYFCNTFWPDFDKKEFEKAILDYQKRERRFGKTREQLI